MQEKIKNNLIDERKYLEDILDIEKKVLRTDDKNELRKLEKQLREEIPLYITKNGDVADQIDEKLKKLDNQIKY